MPQLPVCSLKSIFFYFSDIMHTKLTNKANLEDICREKELAERISYLF
jgi:hypothetical protein